MLRSTRSQGVACLHEANYWDYRRVGRLIPRRRILRRSRRLLPTTNSRNKSLPSGVTRTVVIPRLLAGLVSYSSLSPTMAVSSGFESITSRMRRKKSGCGFLRSPFFGWTTLPWKGLIIELKSRPLLVAKQIRSPLWCRPMRKPSVSSSSVSQPISPRVFSMSKAITWMPRSRRASMLMSKTVRTMKSGLRVGSPTAISSVRARLFWVRLRFLADAHGGQFYKYDIKTTKHQ